MNYGIPEVYMLNKRQAMFKSLYETNKLKQCIAEYPTISIFSISVHIINHHNILLRFNSYL